MGEVFLGREALGDGLSRHELRRWYRPLFRGVYIPKRATPSLARSHRTRSDGVLFESPAGWTISVVTPAMVFILRSMCSSQPVQRFHSAALSRVTHASTAASMPIASSLPTLYPRCGP